MVHVGKSLPDKVIINAFREKWLRRKKVCLIIGMSEFNVCMCRGVCMCMGCERGMCVEGS